MNSPIKLPPLPPLPPETIVDESADGDRLFGQDEDALRAWATAYAEQAVRDALAAQVPVAWMTDDGRVSTDETKRTAMAAASRPFFHIPLAIIPENNHE